LNKTKRKLLWISGGIFSLFLLFMITVQFLISYNQAFIRELAITQIKSRIQGEVTLGSINPAFFKAFPDIAVNLHELAIRDSLWDQHQHDFLKAKNIYLYLSWISLFKGKPEVKKVSIEDGHLHLYTDACGYRNLNLIEQPEKPKSEGSIPVFTLRRTRLIMENEFLNARHDIDVDYLYSQTTKKDSTTLIDVSIRSFVHGIGFNLEKGSYLKEKTLDGKVLLTYFPHQKLELTKVNLNIQKHPYLLHGAFYLDQDTMTYALGIYTKQVLYKDAVSVLTASIQLHLDSINVSLPFDAEATVAGRMARKVVPTIATRFIVKGATMETPIGQLKNCSYTGHFCNQVDCQSLPGDPNSEFTFSNLKADWNDITLTSCQVQIYDLIHPFLQCDLQSTFELEKLNHIGGSATLQFLTGTGKMDITYQGAITSKDTILPVLNGKILLEKAEVKYLPRQLTFKECSGEITFSNQDLILNQLLATAGTTQLTMKGQILNLLAMLNLNPEKLTMDWTISTPALHLGDFISFVGESSQVQAKKHSSNNRIIKASANIDKMLRDGTVRLTMIANNLLYKKFTATGVSATILVTGNKLSIERTRLNHAGGTITVEGALTNANRVNPLSLKSTITHVDIPGLFKAFDNFGQDAITAGNMKGKLSAKASLSLVLTDKAEIKENSMQGEIDFSVKNGELNNFEPLVKITTTALKNRDFSHITFAELQNRFSVKGSAFYIPKMEIRSNVAVLFVEGIYDTKLGTDMSIQVPVSNLSKTENDIMEKTGKPGVNVRLRAKTGDDGKLNISWDPLNNASKKRKAIMDSNSVPPSGKEMP
jgi:hypothetical protein